MFTYLPNNDPQKIQEADIEILTSGPRNAVQYTNQPSNNKEGNVVPQATVNSTNPGAVDWTQWMVYRVDWLPKMTTWYVNGESVANIAFQAPRDPSGLIINMWGDGGSWTGNMSTYNEAFLQIQWMEVVYNTSGPVSGLSKSKRVGEEQGAAGVLEKRKGKPGCKIVCGVDEQVTVTGTPALLFNNTAAGVWRADGLRRLPWLSTALVTVLVFGFI